MRGWRKRQIHDRQMRRMQDQESYLHEPDGTHEGHWPQEALRVLRLSPPSSTWIPLLRSQSVVDVLRGGTGRRGTGSLGAGSGEGVAGDRSDKEQAK